MAGQRTGFGRWFARWRGTDAGPEFWVDLATGAVEEGRQSPAGQRMGPYPTREAAQHAYDTAQERNEAWDEEDRRWHRDDWPKDTGPAAP